VTSGCAPGKALLHRPGNAAGCSAVGVRLSALWVQQVATIRGQLRTIRGRQPWSTANLNETKLDTLSVIKVARGVPGAGPSVPAGGAARGLVESDGTESARAPATRVAMTSRVPLRICFFRTMCYPLRGDWQLWHCRWLRERRTCFGSAPMNARCGLSTAAGVRDSAAAPADWANPPKRWADPPEAPGAASLN